jgi:hypothetical protein
MKIFERDRETEKQADRQREESKTNLQYFVVL